MEREEAVDQLHQYMLNQRNRNDNSRGSYNVDGDTQGHIQDGNFFFTHDMNKNQAQMLGQGQAVYDNSNNNNAFMNSDSNSGGSSSSSSSSNDEKGVSDEKDEDGTDDGAEDGAEDGADGVSSFMSGR